VLSAVAQGAQDELTDVSPAEPIVAADEIRGFPVGPGDSAVAAPSDSPVAAHFGSLPWEFPAAHRPAVGALALASPGYSPQSCSRRLVAQTAESLPGSAVVEPSDLLELAALVQPAGPASAHSGVRQPAPAAGQWDAPAEVAFAPPPPDG